MNINATLLVQSLNFFIAYLLFRFIFLKPGYRAVLQDHAHHDSLQEQLVQGREHYDAKKYQQKEQWMQVHQFYIKNKPSITNRQEIFQGVVSSVSLKPFSEKEQHALREKAVSLIVKRIG